MSEFVQNWNCQQTQSIKQYRSDHKGNYKDALKTVNATALLTAQMQSLATSRQSRKGGQKYAAAILSPERSPGTLLRDP